MDKYVPIILSEKDFTDILNYLGNLPYNNSAPLIQKFIDLEKAAMENNEKENKEINLG